MWTLLATKQAKKKNVWINGKKRVILIYMHNTYIFFIVHTQVVPPALLKVPLAIKHWCTWDFSKQLFNSIFHIKIKMEFLSVVQYTLPVVDTIIFKYKMAAIVGFDNRWIWLCFINKNIILQQSPGSIGVTGFSVWVHICVRAVLARLPYGHKRLLAKMFLIFSHKTNSDLK